MAHFARYHSITTSFTWFLYLSSDFIVIVIAMRLEFIQSTWIGASSSVSRILQFSPFWVLFDFFFLLCLKWNQRIDLISRVEIGHGAFFQNNSQSYSNSFATYHFGFEWNIILAFANNRLIFRFLRPNPFMNLLFSLESVSILKHFVELEINGVFMFALISWFAFVFFSSILVINELRMIDEQRLKITCSN